jgi:hypothetical protein
VQDYVVADSRVAEEPVYDYKPADVVAQDYVEVQDYVVVDSRVAEEPVYDCKPADVVARDCVVVRDYVAVDSRVAEEPDYDCRPADVVVQDYYSQRVRKHHADYMVYLLAYSLRSLLAVHGSLKQTDSCSALHAACGKIVPEWPEHAFHSKQFVPVQ